MIKNTKNLVETDPDYIDSKKYKHSLSRYKKSHPGKTPDRQIAHMLSKSELEIEQIYNRIINKARQFFKIDVS